MCPNEILFLGTALESFQSDLQHSNLIKKKNYKKGHYSSVDKPLSTYHTKCYILDTEFISTNIKIFFLSRILERA